LSAINLKCILNYNVQRQEEIEVIAATSGAKTSSFVWILLPIAILVPAVLLFWKYHKVNLAEFISQSGRQRYNVLLITIDTLRADHLDCYGFQDIRTPNIDALAASGVMFVICSILSYAGSVSKFEFMTRYLYN